MAVVTVEFLGVFQQLAGGKANVSVEATDIKDVFAALEAKVPGIKQHVQNEDGSMKRYVNVYLNDENINDLDQLDTAVGKDDNILVLPAIAGG